MGLGGHAGKPSMRLPHEAVVRLLGFTRVKTDDFEGGGRALSLQAQAAKTQSQGDHDTQALPFTPSRNRRICSTGQWIRLGPAGVGSKQLQDKTACRKAVHGWRIC